jgi:DNA end-binding protein Ku
MGQQAGGDPVAGAYRWKGTVQFAGLTFNVLARSAVKEAKVGFNQHHAECGGRLRQGGMVCEGCGEVGITKEQIVRGYEGRPGIDEEYLASLEAEASQVCRLDKMVRADEIDPRYFQKSYNVVPEKGSERLYVLFLRELEDLGLYAVGTVVMGGKEYIAAFRPRVGATGVSTVAMELLYWPEELVEAAEAEDSIEEITITPKELGLGRKVAEKLTAPFAPKGYINQYAEDLHEYLARFVAGEAPAVITPRASVQSPASKSLEDALAASLAMLGDDEEEQPKPKKAASRKKAAA